MTLKGGKGGNRSDAIWSSRMERGVAFSLLHFCFLHFAHYNLSLVNHFFSCCTNTYIYISICVYIYNIYGILISKLFPPLGAVVNTIKTLVN